MEQARLLGERYELSEVLGRGGMAEVRLGRDIRLGRTVAVKTLRSDLALDSTFQARFRREAQSAASLNHPSIVSVYDTGEDYADGVPVPYIVMEYVDGQTLRELLSSGRKLLPVRAMEIAAGTLSALDYSHHNGIVHRDIKPGNVMLTRQGTVKVMDFGIARAVADASATMTATAAVIGTAQYLSPEQAKGEKVDARSDLYSAGCLLYELLTGQPPFTGDSPVSVAYQHVRENPKPPSQIDDHVTPAMDAIVLKALAKNADNRYQSAAEMREDIERALDGQPVAAPAVMTDAPTEQVRRSAGPATAAMAPVRDERPSRGRRGLGAAMLLLAVIAVAVLGLVVGRDVLGSEGAKTTVPAVQGLTQEEAREDLENADLVPIVAFENDPNVSENLVIRQDPAADTTLTSGAEVTLVVSQGEARSVMPDVVGQLEADARKVIAEARLEVGDVKRENSERPKGEVLSTSPKAGADRDPGARVDLVVSNGIPLVEVPNVVGLPHEQAFTILVQAGFKVAQPVAEIDDRVAPGAVLRQSPSGEDGIRVPKGSEVSYIVAQAPPVQEQPPPVEEEPPPVEEEPPVDEEQPPVEEAPTEVDPPADGTSGDQQNCGDGLFQEPCPEVQNPGAAPAPDTQQDPAAGSTQDRAAGSPDGSAVPPAGSSDRTMMSGRTATAPDQRVWGQEGPAEEGSTASSAGQPDTSGD